MAEASGNETGRSREMAVATNLSLEIDRFPRNLLRGFMSVAADNDGRNLRSQMFRGEDCTYGDEESEIELNLGLSLGGRFGVDKTPGKLKRSSSILGTTPILLEQDDSSAAAQPSVSTYATGLTRSTSLPTEMEEEWRKRKEMQTLRRMEAKRRRCEKQKSCRVGNSGNSDCPTALFAFPQKNLSSSTQGFADSDGRGRRRGSSSNLSELESKNQQGSSNSCGDGRSLSIITGCSSQERSSHEMDQKSGVSGAKADETEEPWSCQNLMDRKGKRSAAELEMPCVFTKGEGPNGRRVQGILYKYGKGEEVRIMCVCHGSFLSPAEFVKHAGGGDVDHPLRHIVVNTSTFS